MDKDIHINKDIVACVSCYISKTQYRPMKMRCKKCNCAVCSVCIDLNLHTCIRDEFELLSEKVQELKFNSAIERKEYEIKMEEAEVINRQYEDLLENKRDIEDHQRKLEFEIKMEELNNNIITYERELRKLETREKEIDDRERELKEKIEALERKEKEMKEKIEELEKKESIKEPIKEPIKETVKETAKETAKEPTKKTVINKTLKPIKKEK